MVIDKKLNTKFDQLHVKINEMKDGIIPRVIATTRVIDCMTQSNQDSSYLAPTGPGYPKMWYKNIDTLSKFQNYVSKVNNSFMALKDVE
jgi:hypothetical protein